MKILVLTSRLPAPPDRGDRLRAGGFVADLAREHEVHVVSFTRGRAEQPHVAALEGLGARVSVISRTRARAMVSVGSNAWRRAPLQVSYYRSRAMRRLVDGLLADGGFDLVYVQMLRMVPYVIDRGDTYRVVDLTDVVSMELERSLPYRPWPQRLLYRIEAGRVARFEQSAAARADEVWLISGRERTELLERCPVADAVVVPNRLDLDRFPEPRPDAVRPGRLVLVGNFAVAHNLDAARFLVHEILPALRRQAPDATVRLVGPGGARAIARLARGDGVTATGWVDDLAAELHATDLFVAPLRFCAGVQNKVVEAMAAGTPVVTTPLVQQGLDAVAGEHLAVAEGTDRIVATCAELLRDRARRDRLAVAGRKFVRERFTERAASARVAAIEAEAPTRPERP